MISLEAVTNLHRDCIARWHEQAIDNPHDGFLRIACEQLSYNFRLWHEEDRARSPTASDAEIAQVKRAIDKLNQQRNDWIEKLDDWITEELARRKVSAPADAPQNTETLGSTIDRLSILEEIARLAPHACTWQIKERLYRRGVEEKTDVRRVFAILRGAGYRGYAPIETLGPGDPRDKLRRFLAEVREALL